MPCQKPVESLVQVCTDSIASLVLHTVCKETPKKQCSLPVSPADESAEAKNATNSISADHPDEVVVMVPEVPKSVPLFGLAKGGLKVPGNSEAQELETPKTESSSIIAVGCLLNGDNSGCKLENGTALNDHDKLREFVEDLADDLTSHSSVHLHYKLFYALVGILDPVYMQQKKTRSLIRVIIPRFLNCSLREFDFSSAKMFSEAEMCKALYDRLEKSNNLQKLKMGRSCYWRLNVVASLREQLVRLPLLKVLHINYICTPDMIQGLSTSCCHLEELSLMGSDKITDQEVQELANCHSLCTLNIMGTKITGCGCWQLLTRLPHLIHLQHCPFNCNSDTLIFQSRAQVLEYIQHQMRRRSMNRLIASQFLEADQTELRNQHLNAPQIVSNATSQISSSSAICSGSARNLNEPPFKLQDFWLFNPGDYELLLTLLCPDTHHLRLDFVLQDLSEEPDTSVLAQLVKLNALTLKLYDSVSSNLSSQLLEAIGARITTLDLHLGDDWFFVAPVQNIITQSCPHLERLFLQGDYKGQMDLEDGDSRLDFTLAPGSLPFLEELHICGVVTDLRLHHILLHAPNIERVRLDGQLEWLHDETFLPLKDSFPHLKELWFNVSTSVTLRIIRSLLQGDNQLKLVGRLCHLAESSKESYRNLLGYKNRHNLDVQLIWVTDQRKFVT